MGICPLCSEEKSRKKIISKKEVISNEEDFFYEKDNMGTRLDTVQKANSYWLIQRPGMNKTPPFVLYQFSSSYDALSALLDLPYIHKAKDSNNLICERIMDFGYYEVEDGLYEAMISSSDLTLEEYQEVEKSFKSHNGILKNHLEPSSSQKAYDYSVGNKSNVKFVQKYSKNGFTYECYEAKNKADAMMFLSGKVVTEGLYYICVDTPEGNFGRDKNGIYEE